MWAAVRSIRVGALNLVFYFRWKCCHDDVEMSHVTQWVQSALEVCYSKSQDEVIFLNVPFFSSLFTTLLVSEWADGWWLLTEAVIAQSRYNPGICLERLNKSRINFSKHSWHPSREIRTEYLPHINLSLYRCPPIILLSVPGVTWKCNACTDLKILFIATPWLPSCSLPSSL